MDSQSGDDIFTCNASFQLIHDEISVQCVRAETERMGGNEKRGDNGYRILTYQTPPRHARHLSRFPLS